MPIPVELNDLAFGIANSQSSEKETRRVSSPTGKRDGFVRTSMETLKINPRIGKRWLIDHSSKALFLSIQYSIDGLHIIGTEILSSRGLCLFLSIPSSSAPSDTELVDLGPLSPFTHLHQVKETLHMKSCQSVNYFLFSRYEVEFFQRTSVGRLSYLFFPLLSFLKAKEKRVMS